MCDLPIQQQNVNVLSPHSFSCLHSPHPQRVKDPSRRRLCVYKEIHGHIWPGSERFCLSGHLQSHGLLSIAQLVILSGSGVKQGFWMLLGGSVNRASGAFSAYSLFSPERWLCNGGSAGVTTLILLMISHNEVYFRVITYI